MPKPNHFPKIPPANIITLRAKTLKTKHRATPWSRNLTPGHISAESHFQKDIYAPMFIATLFTIAKTWKQPKCPLAEKWIKMWHRYAMDN